jgi:hypothetical protein
MKKKKKKEKEKEKRKILNIRLQPSMTNFRTRHTGFFSVGLWPTPASSAFYLINRQQSKTGQRPNRSSGGRETFYAMTHRLLPPTGSDTGLRLCSS